jgi:hypothetical protein
MRNSFQSIFLPTGITRNLMEFSFLLRLCFCLSIRISSVEASWPMCTKFGMNFLPLEAVMAPYFLTSDMAACICELGEALAFACVLVLRWCVLIHAGKKGSLWEDDDVVHCEVGIWRSCGIFFASGLIVVTNERWSYPCILGSWFRVSWIMGFIVQLDKTYWFWCFYYLHFTCFGNLISHLQESQLSNSAMIGLTVTTDNQNWQIVKT